MTRAYLLLLLGCPAATPTDTSEQDTDTDTDTDSDTDADADTDADTDTDSDADTDTDTDPCAQPSCDVGTGRDAFELLAPGGDIQLVHGPQGGWHVDMAVRTYSTGVVVRLTPQVRVVGGAQLAGGEGAADQVNQALSTNGTCNGDAWQLQAIFDDNPVVLEDICALSGVELELTMDFEEPGGAVSGSCTQRGFAVLDPIDVDLCSPP